MPISVDPTLAKRERPNPRKMSPMPQMAKLPTKNATTRPMMALPTQLEEAFRIPRSMVSTLLKREDDGRRRRREAHHREGASRPQPCGATICLRGPPLASLHVLCYRCGGDRRGRPNGREHAE